MKYDQSMPTAKPKTKVPNLDLSKKSFLLFLEENPKKQFKFQDTTDCPIAKFVNSQLVEHPGLYADIDGGDEVNIFSKRKADLENGEHALLKSLKRPAWMDKFVDEFDRSADDRTKITGSKVLSELLER